MLDSVTKTRINTARDILVGKVPDPKSQVEQITIALIYKFMDDMDVEAEELGGKRTFFSGEYAKYSWRKIFDPRQSGHELLNLYSEAITKMDINPGVPKLFRDIFKNAYLPYRDPETLKSFLKIINEFEYTHSEKLGDAFEFLLSILGSQGDAGQFRTPRHIIDFMVAIIDPKKHEVILDPACGTAGFLISSYKHIIKQNSSNYVPDEAAKVISEGTQSVNEVILTTNGYAGDKLTANERSTLADNMHGYDISPDMVRLSLVNMYLHGVKEPKIFEYDSLTSEDHWNEFSDVILANPPFMSPKGGIRPHKRFSVQSNRSEVLFVDYIVEHLTQDGRAAVIVPEGIIFQSGNAYKQLRKMLVEKYLVGVISLPAGVFQPYSGVKTSILWLDKSLAKKTDKILFVKIENDGFDLGAQRRAIKANDLPEVFKNISKYKSSLLSNVKVDLTDFYLVPRRTIAESSDNNLSGERYMVKKSPITGNYPLTRLGDMCEVQSGYAFKSDLFDVNKGFPIIRIRDIKPSRTNTKYNGSFSEEFVVENDDLLIGMDGEFNATLWKGGKALLNQRVCRLLNYKGIIKEYIFRLIQEKLKEIEDKTYAVTVKHIAAKQILDIEIPLPPLSIQEEIASEIDRYQKIIDGARQVVENYQPRIDIDPAWEMVELGDVCEHITKGTTPTTNGYKFQDSGISFIKIENISKDGTTSKDKMSFIDEECHNNLKRSQLKENDILFSIAGTKMGITGIVDNSLIPANTNQALSIIRSKDNFVPQFIMHYLMSENIQNQIESIKVGVAQFNLSLKQVSQILIPQVEKEIQKQIVSKIEEERRLVNANKKLIELFEQKIKDRIAKVWGE